MKGQIARYFSMEGYAIRPLTLRSIGGHYVLLDAADLLDSIVESSCQHNQVLNRSDT